VNFLELRKGTVIIEAQATTEITVDLREGNKEGKIYFRARDQKDRDAWLRAMLEALARAPFGDMSKQFSTSPNHPREDSSSSSSDNDDEDNQDIS
jgi:hypothetical protein